MAFESDAAPGAHAADGRAVLRPGCLAGPQGFPGIGCPGPTKVIASAKTLHGEEARPSGRIVRNLGAGLLLQACAGLACLQADDAATEIVHVGQDLQRCRFEDAKVAPDGRVRIAGEDAGITHTSGAMTCDYQLADDAAVTVVTLLGEDVPVLQTAAEHGRWPLVATDIIMQARYLRSDGSYGPWEPRNVLLGGDFADQNQNGVPDSINVLVGDATDKWSLIADLEAVGPPPDGFWLGRESIATKGDLVANDPNPASPTALRLTKPWTGGGLLASMTTALVAPSTTWTVSGWTRWDKPDGPDLMARFHELDSSGQTTTKYVLVGDDDFHQPTGSSPWRWRALTFTSEPATTGLMLIPARFTASMGEMSSAGFEIREGSVFDPAQPTVSEPDFSTLETWEISHPDAASVVSLGPGLEPGLQLVPSAGEVVTARQRNPFPVTAGRVYAFTVAMENRASAEYDSTHDTWVSCYLEFLDGSMRVLDHAKAQVFRPRLEHPVAAAATAPPGSMYGRFLVAGLHKTYSAKKLEGRMTAVVGGLRVASSSYDPSFQPRPAQRSVALRRQPGSVAVQVRARLLTRDPGVQPSFRGLAIQSRGLP